MAHVYSLSSLEIEDWDTKSLYDHPLLYSDFKGILGYVIPCFRNKQREWVTERERETRTKNWCVGAMLYGVFRKCLTMTQIKEFLNDGGWRYHSLTGVMRTVWNEEGWCGV